MKIIQCLPELNTGGVERGVVELSHALVCAGHQSYVVSNGGIMVQQLEAEGGVHLQMPIGLKRLSTLACVQRLKRIIIDIKPDIIHVRSRVPAWVLFLACRLIPKNQRPLIVSTVHGLYSKPWYSQVMTFSDHIIAISEIVKTHIQTQFSIPESKISLIHRGCDAKLFCQKPLDPTWRKAWDSQYPQTVGKKILTLPARITKWKGIDKLIELVSQLDESYHGLIVGPVHAHKRDYYRAIMKLITDKGLENRITFCGARQDIDQIYRLSDIVYNLSTHPEPFGRTVCEACNVGTKVIAWGIGGPMESLSKIFPEGLVEPGNMDALVKRTIELVGRHDLAPIGDLFTSHMTTQKTMACYHRLCHAQQPLQPVSSQ